MGLAVDDDMAARIYAHLRPEPAWSIAQHTSVVSVYHISSTRHFAR